MTKEAIVTSAADTRSTINIHITINMSINIDIDIDVKLLTLLELD